MADHAHEVRALPVRIDRVAHGLAIDREARVLRGELPVPALQGLIELLRLDPHQHVTDDREALDQDSPRTRRQRKCARALWERLSAHSAICL